MLIGEYKSNVGDKRRISIPKKLRDELIGKVYLTRGYESCLIMLDSQRWEKLTALVDKKSILNESARYIKRFLVGGAMEIEYDSQGRFVLADSLSSFANIKEEVVFLGVENWIEIWDKERWEKKLPELTKGINNITERLLS